MFYTRDMRSRTIVVVSDRLAYANGHLMFSGGDMDAFIRKYRAAGWWVDDQRARSMHTV